jgi:ferredoxin
MSEAGSKVTRRKFMIAGSAAAAAAPLLVELAATQAQAESAISSTAAAVKELPKGTKVYFINDGCVGCQVCRTYCPTKAIRFGNCRNEIVQSKCIHCGTCYEGCNVCNISVTVVA